MSLPDPERNLHQVEALKERNRSLTVKYLTEEFWIFDELWKRIEHHIQICDQQIKKFSRWALFTRYTLPLLTAFASGLAGLLAGVQAKGAFTTRLPITISIIVAVVSFLATILSALNAAMRPALQYGHYVRFINKFWMHRILLEIEAEKAFLSAGNDKNSFSQKIHDVVALRNVELNKTIEDFSEASVSNIGIPADAKQA